MDATQRYGEFITYLATQGARLREAKMVRVRWAPSADEAGLRGDERPMILISFATGLAKDQLRTGCVGDCGLGRIHVRVGRRQGILGLDNGLRGRNRHGGRLMVAGEPLELGGERILDAG